MNNFRMKFSEVVMKLFVLFVSFFASTSLAVAADIWTYESGEALHVVWSDDGSDSYRLNNGYAHDTRIYSDI